jgi:hypothetical protein
MPDDGGILLLVADQVAHRGQAARDGMRPVGDAVPERQVTEESHMRLKRDRFTVAKAISRLKQ